MEGDYELLRLILKAFDLVEHVTDLDHEYYDLLNVSTKVYFPCLKLLVEHQRDLRRFSNAELKYFVQEFVFCSN